MLSSFRFLVNDSLAFLLLLILLASVFSHFIVFHLLEFFLRHSSYFPQPKSKVKPPKKKKKHRAPNQWDLDFGNGPWIKVESLDREHLLFCLLLNRIFNFHFHPGSLLVEECQHLWFKKEESKEKKDRKAKMIPINAIPLRTVYL